MDHNYLPTNKIQAITKITNEFELDDAEISDLNNHTIEYINTYSNEVALRWCVKNEKLDIIKHIMEKYPCAQKLINRLIKPAAASGQIEIVSYFLKKCRPKHKEEIGKKALDLAVVNNHFDLIKFLVNDGILSTGTYVIRDAFGYSINSNNMEITKYLIEKNTRSGNSFLLNYLRLPSELEIVKLLITNCDNTYNTTSIFNESISRNYLDVAQYLIDVNFDRYILYDFALTIVIAGRILPLMEYLLGKYMENNLPIPDTVITKKVNDVNRLLIKYVATNQYHRFNSKIVESLVTCKSARNV